MTAAARPADIAPLLAGADRLTVLTGAGISTDSGIPDFRGPQGVWTRDPGSAALFDFDVYMSDPDVRRRVWRMRRDHPAWTARPNAAHRALADLDRAGRLRALITQNIDGLHQAAGTDDHHVIEVHGTIHWVVCMGCGALTPTPEVLARLEEESDPRCVICGGVQKADTISFGQRLKTDVLECAVDAAATCDVFVAIGTSLAVHPVAGLCDIALDGGIPLVVVNAEETPYDDRATAVLRDPIGEVVPALAAYALGAAR
ncbi:NAD-dependent deacetylase [Streptomonospora nanhaiensis]|uniref:SIR2 family NAD-dependent protein deacylase n=1 Tax=Streptomonospora nanhaiensis TaxID=1323731 RepID=UPI001C999518|nr:Sir2 family NAD-dependent protein deacetylase [Streptomonospora nanhaiensis]MBX9390140.1 Sir2 family NAD-dependent protein deacetylase [Streptomonospora nanhaiensis]